MHTSLVESMTEKDIFGENMIYCEDCGFKGSKYLEDTPLPFADIRRTHGTILMCRRLTASAS